MTSRPAFSKGRGLLRLAVAGAVVMGAPVALAGTANAAPDSEWDALAQCESGGDWSINTGNGYSGGLQFSPTTWRAFGGSGSAHQASRSEQIAVAEKVLAEQGWNAWPSCSSKLGLSGSAEPGERVRAAAPTEDEAPAEEPAPAAAPAAPTAPAGDGNHTVVSGDTLSEIAVANGTSWQQLWEANRDVLTNPHVLRIGQTITV